MADYKLYIGSDAAGSPDEVVEDLLDVQVDKSHSSLSGWSVKVPFAPSLQEHILKDCWLYDGSEKLYRGIIESFTNSADSDTTTMQGRGYEVQLTHATDSVRYSLRRMHEVIDDFGTNHTYASSWTTEPPGPADNIDEYGEGVSNALTDIFSPSSGSPVYLNANGYLRTYQTAHTEDAQNLTLNSGSTVTDERKYSGGQAIKLAASGDNAEQSPTWDYSVGSSGFAWFLKMHGKIDTSAGDSITINFYCNGTLYTSYTPSGDKFDDDWYDVFNNPDFTDENSTEPSTPSGPFKVEVTGTFSSSDTYVIVDAASVLDTAYTYEFPDNINSRGYYSGPQHYADGIFAEANVNTSGVSYIEAHQRHDATYSTDFRNQNIINSGTINEKALPVRVNTPDEPREGVGWTYKLDSAVDYFTFRHYFTPEEVSEQSKSGEVRPVGIDKVAYVISQPVNEMYISDKKWAGEHFEILKDMVDLAEYRFTVTNGDATTFRAFPEGFQQPEPNWRVLSDAQKIDYTNYANKVTVNGGRTEDGSVLTATAKDTAEINELGRTIHHYERKPDIANQGTLDKKAEKVLNSKIEQKNQSGSMSALAEFTETGYKLPISPWSRVFKDAGRCGINALGFRGGSSIQDVGVHYTLNADEVLSGGTVEDRGANDTDGSALGTYSEVDGTVEGALHLDGSSGTVEGPSPSYNDDFEISMWVKLDTLPASGSEYVLSERGHSDTDYNWKYSVLDDGSVKAYMDNYNGGEYISGTSTQTLSTGTWYWLSFAYNWNNSEITIYIDNAADTTITKTGGYEPYYQATSNIYVGSAGNATSYLDGTIDDYRQYYPRRLTQSERDEIYGLRGDGNYPNEPPHRAYELGGVQSASSSDERALEFIIRPENLHEMADTDFVYLASHTDEPKYCILYGDGSLEFNPYSGSEVVTAPADTIENKTAQRISLHTQPGSTSARILVNGTEVGSAYHSASSWGFGGFAVGSRYGGQYEGAFEGGIDDVRFWYAGDGGGTLAYDFSINFEDLRYTDKSYPSSELWAYHPFDDESTPTVAQDTVNTGSDGSIKGAYYESEHAQLEEVSYSLGDEGTMDLKFNISGYMDVELSEAVTALRRNRENL